MYDYLFPIHIRRLSSYRPMAALIDIICHSIRWIIPPGSHKLKFENIIIIFVWCIICIITKMGSEYQNYCNYDWEL